MIVLIGSLIVLGSVIGGFLMGGGYLGALLHLSELIIIGGAALGAMVIMSPRKVLIDLARGLMACMKGAPYHRGDYEEMFKALYELFMLGRRNGMIALEEHVLEPRKSAILAKYPHFLANTKAVEFLCSGLRPIIDGKIKPDQLKHLFELELKQMETEGHAPVSVLKSTADAMPGFGIVAAVLGIVITMMSISGPIEVIGEKVAVALVGTFLGIFLSYGFLNPLATNLEFYNESRMSFFHSIAACVVSFANGMAPLTAIEVGRRGIAEDVRPGADELEKLLKSAGNAQPAAA